MFGCISEDSPKKVKHNFHNKTTKGKLCKSLSGHGSLSSLVWFVR